MNHLPVLILDLTMGYFPLKSSIKMVRKWEDHKNTRKEMLMS